MQKALSALEQCVTLLVHPSTAAVEECTALLAVAIEDMERCQAGPRAPDRQLASQAAKLRNTLNQVQILLRNAAAFYQGMARFMAVPAESYTPQGMAEIRAHVRNVSVLG